MPVQHKSACQFSGQWQAGQEPFQTDLSIIFSVIQYFYPILGKIQLLSNQRQNQKVRFACGRPILHIILYSVAELWGLRQHVVSTPALSFSPHANSRSWRHGLSLFLLTSTDNF